MINADYYFTFGYKVSNELMKMCLQQAYTVFPAPLCEYASA